MDKDAQAIETGLTVRDMIDNPEPIVLTEHIIELLNAEQEGRLIVLPCKPGDTVYEVVPACDGNYDFCTYLGGRGNFRCASNMCGGYVVEVPFDALFRHMIGKTLFLTREEAEAALAKDNNVPGKKEE